MTFIHHTAARWALAAALLCAGVSAHATTSNKLNLTGAQEVPPVSTKGSGWGSIVVASDGAVRGSIKTKGVPGTAAHVHLGAAGVNGPVVVALTKNSGGLWSVPAGTRLNAEQLKAYRAGALYVNVHTDDNKDGEIRAQLRP